MMTPTLRTPKGWRRGDRSTGPARNPLALLWQLEQYRGSFQILLFLYKEKSASTSRLRSRLKSGQVSIQSSLRSLVRLGFIERNCEPDFPFAKAYSLTGRGVSLVETPPRSWHTLLPV
jgi:DNA-binding HxlR family transcriptional regulator